MVTVNSTEWTQLPCEFTVPNSGLLTAARMSVVTSSSTVDFLVDDALLYEDTGEAETTVFMVPGTWRREVLP